MVISCSTCQKEEQECTLVEYLIYAVLSQFKIRHSLCGFFPHQIYIPKVSEFTLNFFSSPSLTQTYTGVYLIYNYDYKKGEKKYSFE